jgi:hypothetical protein
MQLKPQTFGHALQRTAEGKLLSKLQKKTPIS